MSKLSEQEWLEFELTHKVLIELETLPERQLYLQVLGWGRQGIHYKKGRAEIYYINRKVPSVSLLGDHALYAFVSSLRVKEGP